MPTVATIVAEEDAAADEFAADDNKFGLITENVAGVQICTRDVDPDELSNQELLPHMSLPTMVTTLRKERSKLKKKLQDSESALATVAEANTALEESDPDKDGKTDEELDGEIAALKQTLGKLQGHLEDKRKQPETSQTAEAERARAGTDAKFVSTSRKRDRSQAEQQKGQQQR